MKKTLVGILLMLSAVAAYGQDTDVAANARANRERKAAAKKAAEEIKPATTPTDDAERAAALARAAKVARGEKLTPQEQADLDAAVKKAQDAPPVVKHPTPEAIAAAKDVVLAILANRRDDMDRAKARLQMESEGSDQNIFLNMDFNIMLVGVELHALQGKPLLPYGCAGAINKQLATGEWSSLAMPKICKEDAK